MVASAAKRRRKFLIDPLDFVEFIQRHDSLAEEFCYMNRVGAYEYEVVPYSEINPTDHLTVSARGVTHTLKGEQEFLT